MPREELLSRAREADGLLSMLTDDIDVELLDAAPRLRVVSQMAVGLDNVDLDACERRGISVGHTPDVLTETVADTAFVLMGAAARRIAEAAEAVKEGRWGPWSPEFMVGAELWGTTVGIVGMGRIGRALARRCQGFDMRVIYSSPRPSGPGDRVGLDRLLEEADHVVLTAPLNEETKGMIGTAELRAMGGDSFLTNVARGQLIVTGDLVAALRERLIAGAALDVTDPEPLPPDHPLLGLPNCLVVPHIGSASRRARREMAGLAVENLRAGLAGEEMPARAR